MLSREKAPYGSPSCVWYPWKGGGMTTRRWLQPKPEAGSRRNPDRAASLALPVLSACAFDLGCQGLSGSSLLSVINQS